MPGYIYLIRMADDVYKVGRTFQEFNPRLRRFEAYPGDSELVFVIKCPEDRHVTFERLIIQEFRARYGDHRRGAEYFVGDESQMVQTIINVCTKPIELPPPPVAFQQPRKSHEVFFIEKLRESETETMSFLSHKLYDEYEKWTEFKPEIERDSFGLWLFKLGEGVSRKVVGGNKKLYTVHRDVLLRRLTT
jgi:hypothetical protein